MPGSAKIETQSSNQPNPKPPLTLLSGGLFAAFLAALIAAPDMGGVTGPLLGTYDGRPGNPFRDHDYLV